MSTNISKFAQVHPKAELGVDVHIGPFCVVGPRVRIGDGTRLESHVALVGNTTVGERNRFFPCAIIGTEPQDLGYRGGDTGLNIGDDNVFREGVTVNVGAEKDDYYTTIGNRNLLMSNAHVAHNCRLFNDVILVNGVLLGGHVHVHDGAIISGNTVVHHFSTIGTLAFISGGSRVPHDVPPYMLFEGADNRVIKTINIVGMRRRGISEATIRMIKRSHRLLYREHRKLGEVYEEFREELDGVFPLELTTLLDFVAAQQKGRLGRARDAAQLKPAEESNDSAASQAA